MTARWAASLAGRQPQFLKTQSLWQLGGPCKFVPHPPCKR